ncbi:hypothetical protein Tco_0735364 [Tanacetum coccineum]
MLLLFNTFLAYMSKTAMPQISRVQVMLDYFVLRMGALRIAGLCSIPIDGFDSSHEDALVDVDSEAEEEDEDAAEYS